MGTKEVEAYKKKVIKELTGCSDKNRVEALLREVGFLYGTSRFWYETSHFWKDKYLDVEEKEEGND